MALNASVKCLDGGPTLTICLSVECDARLVVENNRINVGRSAGHVASRHDYKAPSSVRRTPSPPILCFCSAHWLSHQLWPFFAQGSAQCDLQTSCKPHLA